METLTFIISMILLIGLILSPIFLFIRIRKLKQSKFNFLTYLVLGLVITAGITLTFAWWADYSDQLLLSHYGYDLDAMNDSERYGNVKSENLEKVKQIEIGYFGIGWPLKAIMTYVFYSPYLLIVYLIGLSFTKMNLKRNNKNALQQKI
jgi:hypothetical protein